MKHEIAINGFTITTLECIFTAMKKAEYEQVFDASVYLYNFVSREGIYPPKVVQGFFSAMAIISYLTMEQFLQIKNIY